MALRVALDAREEWPAFSVERSEKMGTTVFGMMGLGPVVLPWDGHNVMLSAQAQLRFRLLRVVCQASCPPDLVQLNDLRVGHRSLFANASPIAVGLFHTVTLDRVLEIGQTLILEASAHDEMSNQNRLQEPRFRAVALGIEVPDKCPCECHSGNSSIGPHTCCPLKGEGNFPGPIPPFNILSGDVMGPR